jgi:hypothetical protein
VETTWMNTIRSTPPKKNHRARYLDKFLHIRMSKILNHYGTKTRLFSCSAVFFKEEPKR